MNDPNLQMVRGSVDGGYNLAIGEPILLQQHLPFPEFKSTGPYEYPTMEGHSGLMAELKQLHPGSEIVVTNGAKQALLAAFYALHTVERKEVVVHEAPYWPTYPALARLSSMYFKTHRTDGYSNPAEIFCLTSPNNPDSREQGVCSWENRCDVWDGVYAHWMYDWNGKQPVHKIRVCSAAKLLGLSGIRVGWLVTPDLALANAARLYIELTTSGVGTLAQEYVAQALEYMRTSPATNELLRRVRDGIVTNGHIFNGLIREFCDSVMGVPDTWRGMFAFFHVKPEYQERFSTALRTAKVALVNGKSCGMEEEGWYRMNMAHTASYTQEALTKLRSAI